MTLAMDIASFLVAGSGVWVAGTKLSGYADALGKKVGLGQAFMGFVVLATATELPEIATTATAAIVGDASLAINNLFGGIVMQTAILSVADLTLIYGPLTFFTPRPVLLLQGTALIVLLAMTQAAIITQEFLVIAGVGMWPVILAGLYVAALYLLRHYEQHGEWRPINIPEGREDSDQVLSTRRHDGLSVRGLVARFSFACIAVLACGVLLTRSAGAIAVQSHLGSSFVGATILAASTSLPELSTSIAAVRLGAFSMAVANIFGSNLIMVGLLLPADMLYRPGPILHEAGRPAMFVLTIGIVVSAVYLLGLIERKNRQVFRMGYDSWTVLAIYVASLFGLYFIR